MPFVFVLFVEHREAVLNQWWSLFFPPRLLEQENESSQIPLQTRDGGVFSPIPAGGRSVFQLPRSKARAAHLRKKIRTYEAAFFFIWFSNGGGIGCCRSERRLSGECWQLFLLHCSFVSLGLCRCSAWCLSYGACGSLALTLCAPHVFFKLHMLNNKAALVATVKPQHVKACEIKTGYNHL